MEYAEAGVGTAGFKKIKNPPLGLPVLGFLKIEEAGVGNAGFKMSQFLKPSISMPASKQLETGNVSAGFATCP